MRILYVSRETPFTPSGGIATYLEYMVPAMQAAGHEVYLFTWTEGPHALRLPDTAPFRRDHVHVEHLDPRQVWRQCPVPSHNLFMASHLADALHRVIAEWRIDVVEGTDFLAPCLTAYQGIQTRAGAERQLLVTYNHGFIEDFYEADQIDMDAGARMNHLCERQQCRVSDLVIAPSRTAQARLAGYGITENVAALREPYAFGPAPDFPGARADFQYIGRIALSKGIDKLIYLANAIEPVLPLRQIRLIGRIVDTPFRQRDMQGYVRARLSPGLRDRVSFSGFLPRAEARALLEPGALCPSLGSAETFSYACVEAIDAGLLPVVRAGTPMAEFFLEHQARHVLDEGMASVRGLQMQMERMMAQAPAIAADLRAHCVETLDPARIAEATGQLYDARLAAKRGRSLHAAPRAPMGLADLTVLIPAYQPGEEFHETIDSLAWQSPAPPRVLICDDGSTAAAAAHFDYARAMLPDVTVIAQPNGGLLAARNTLIAACETPLALFLDTDDLLAPDLLAHLLEAWNQSPLAPDAVIPQRRNFGESAEPVLQHLLGDHLHLLENDYRMTALIRTEVLREIGFDATRRNGEGDDWAFWLRFTARGYRGILLPEQGFLYRFRKGSMSWPWSRGQNVGSRTMLRAAMEEMCASDPAACRQLARALYAQAVSRQEAG
ncbi:glycosyltransferase [Pseudooceanicola sp. CBS1P-1]|uniref:Glycosyltransferase n=1 Tax=Pseudooceanicola albus TaxID=2692189 RepID=A0A6L7G1F7_9RHOB|nr:MULTISPECIES: glycosyltransferase [Pseudooceanicola]MBT9383264.1 glycosyltransferase [Pseudooceanicola endophyticus]MXN16413.1 glycosyltransferase [Pseudooceanicola albus]